MLRRIPGVMLAALVLLLSLPAAAAPRRPPNIVLLVAEGIGACDPRQAGGVDVPTPRLNQLADGGLRLIQAYAATPSAELDRQAVITGRHPARGSRGESDGGGDQLTLARILATNGYSTGVFPSESAVGAAIPQNAASSRLFEKHTSDACGFIDRNRERPFFLHVSWRLPENPTRADEARLKRYESLGDLRRRHRAAGLVEIDESVGRVLHRLRAHKLEEETLLMFVSEPARLAGRDGWESLSEGNLRTTFLVRWSGRLPAAKLDPRLCSTLDILPTCLAAAKAAVPSEWVLDGANLLPFLERRISKSPHSVLHWRSDTLGGSRQGDWKFIRDLQGNRERLTSIREVDGVFTEAFANDPKRLQTVRSAWESWNQEPHRPPWGRWEADIKAFEQSDRTNPPPRGAVLFLGSSTIRGWKTLSADFPARRTINRGFGGSETADSVAYLDRLVVPHQPRAIVFYGGDNDLAAGRWPEQILCDFQALVSRARAGMPDVRILFLSIKPSPSRRGLMDQIRTTNGLIEGFCRRKAGLDYVDVFTPMLGANGQPRPELFVQDELHMNSEGYAIWADVLRPLLN
jgi:arylsulfatase A-like enzyme/lysophospholipase L1-like esterase